MSQITSISASTDPVLIITAYQEFIDAAFGELQRFNTKLLYGELLAPGILLCTLPSDTHPRDLISLVRQAIQQRPIFVRHLAPVQAVIHLSNTENDIGELALAIAIFPHLLYWNEANVLLYKPVCYKQTRRQLNRFQ